MLILTNCCKQEKEKSAEVMQLVEGQRQKLSVWGSMLDKAEQVMGDEDAAVFLDVGTHKVRVLFGLATASQTCRLMLPVGQQLIQGLHDALSLRRFDKYTHFER
jgi:hypothetical protein